MNKKLLAAAIAAAFVAPSAFGAATLYGQFHTSIDAVDAEAAGVTLQDNFVVDSKSSRFGIKGSEDLGDGLKAIYQMEISVDTDGGGSGQTGSAPFGSYRNTFIGLSGDWGTALVGRHDTPGKVAFYAGGIEVLGDSNLDVNSGSSLTRGNTLSTNNPAGVFHEYRANDAIAYISPSFSGFTFAAAGIPGEDTGTGANVRDGIADHYSFGGWYKGGGFKVGAGYTKYEAGGVDQKVTQITGSYTFGAIQVGAGYETTDNDSFVSGQDYDAWAITGKWSFGNNAITAIYTDAERELAGTKDIDKDGWGVGAEHNFSKRTKAYVSYATAENESNQRETDVISLGMVHKF